MRRKTNVVIFSSGVSEKKGITQRIKSGLEENGCVCCCWRDLFASSNNQDQIALLPMLIKKIPTFDFALLICEGHDKTFLMRGGEQIEINAMRDNVLFEIGLCAVALGLDRVILLADKTVRLPEDLMGINGETAMYEVFLPDDPENENGFSDVISEITDYIKLNDMIYSPVVVGAAASTASGYVTNFVFRCVEHVFDGFRDKESDENIVPEKGKLDMEIYIPFTFSRKTSAAAREKQSELRTGIIETARRRQLEFNYTVEGDRIIIRDYPTTLVTSYNTARTILNMRADDSDDPNAQARFVSKELDLFESALRSLLNESYFENYVSHYYPDERMPKRFDTDAVGELIRHGIKVIRLDY